MLADKRKSIGNTLLGLFVVRPEDEISDDSPSAPALEGNAGAGSGGTGPGKGGTGDPTVDDLIARYSGGAGQKAGSRPPPRLPASTCKSRTFPSSTSSTRRPVPALPKQA